MSPSAKLADPLAGKPSGMMTGPVEGPGFGTTPAPTGNLDRTPYATGPNPAEAVFAKMRGPSTPSAMTHLGEQGAAALAAHAPSIAAGIAGDVSGLAQRLRDGIGSGAGMGADGIRSQVRQTIQTVRDDIRSHLGGVQPTGQHPLNPGAGAGGAPSADRVARITARKTKLDAAGAAYAAGSGTTENKARVASFIASKDARLSARIAGTTPPTRPASFGPKTAGTTPIRDVRASAGMKVRPRP